MLNPEPSIVWSVFITSLARRIDRFAVTSVDALVTRYLSQIKPDEQLAQNERKMSVLGPHQFNFLFLIWFLKTKRQFYLREKGVQ
jgi:hypothetical protein